MHLEGHRNFTSLKSDLVLRISDVSNNRVYFFKIRTLLFETFFPESRGGYRKFSLGGPFFLNYGGGGIHLCGGKTL